MRDRGKEPGTVSSFDAPKHKFKEGAMLLYGGGGEHRKQTVELRDLPKSWDRRIAQAESHSLGALRSVDIVDN
jgi:hypothetical protein